MVVISEHASAEGYYFILLKPHILKIKATLQICPFHVNRLIQNFCATQREKSDLGSYCLIVYPCMSADEKADINCCEWWEKVNHACETIQGS